MQEEQSVSGEEPTGEPAPEPTAPGPEPAPEQAPEQAPASADLLTPQDWAVRLGHIHQAHPHIPQSTTHADWQHAVGDKLHGWSDHAYHYPNEPLKISQADYETALENAAAYPLKEAHGPALSPLLKQKEQV